MEERERERTVGFVALGIMGLAAAKTPELYKALEQQGRGDLDFAAVVTVLEGLSGMEPEPVP